MKHYLIGGLIGFLIGTLFGLSTLARFLFGGGVPPAFIAGETPVSGVDEPYIVEELEVLDVPPLDPATIPAPQPGDEIIQPGD